ncbi:UMP kinase [Patescibacteria group bacterium]|nr:UMP kinase [Patescibacteria group bacterium]MBU1629991.1 UMP kinase [Patescibacteria group bacterium]MBU1908139.1 UMP kinase [Patescibacteria group bacterium]
MRIVLKLSGEAMLGPNKIFPYDPEAMLRIAQEISDAHHQGSEIAIVVGGGNIFRGANGASRGMDRTLADQFGMLATIQNGLALLDLLERACGVKTRLMSGLEVNAVAEPYIMRRAARHLEKGRLVILAGGTGNPFCTTDYAAALRASEIRAELIAKATNTDGVYDKDPKTNSDAVLLPRASYDHCIRSDIKVMDTEAFALCRSQKIPIRIFSLAEKGNITAALTGAEIGSLISD